MGKNSKKLKRYKKKSERLFMSDYELLWTKGSSWDTNLIVQEENVDEMLKSLELEKFIKSYLSDKQDEKTQWSINDSLYSMLLQFFLHIILSIMIVIFNDPLFFQSLWGFKELDNLKLLFKGEIYRITINYSFYHLNASELPDEFDLKFVRITPLQKWRQRDTQFMQKYESCHSYIKSTMRR